MENHLRAPSIAYILKKISDDKALVLFNSIAVSSSNDDRYVPLKEMNLSTKQYYSRVSGLFNAGLIKRHKGKYSLTLLGRVVYDSQMLIGKTLSYYWKLRAIESIETESTQMSDATTYSLPNEEITQLIDALIDNNQVKDILLKSVSSPSIEGNSKMQTPTAVVKQPQDI
jgi:hypothetical protein